MINRKVMKIKIVISFTCALLFMSCQDWFEPKNENISSFDRVYTDPGFAEGLLISAYIRMPSNSLSFNDVATDDAVSNDQENGYRRMATGEWSASFNPVSRWTNSNQAMIYLDQFIDIIDSVEWKWTNKEIHSLYQKRFHGEAYAMRGIIQYHLLQSVAGYSQSGNLLGIPFYKDDNNFNIPRASFEESVNQIYSDFDKALEYLTMDEYKKISSASELPPGYAGVNVDNYNEVFGNELNQRISGRIVKAFKARLALLTASPAFSPNWESDAALWIKAADYAGNVLNTIGGISGLDPNGHKFYLAAHVDAINLGSGIDQKEIIWRRNIVESNSREADNFPPSLYGRGRVNPTQNLVDAFPMADGTPFNPSSPGSNPYNNRDPRLELYIAYNGNTISGQTINTGLGGKENAKDSIATSTRTGYYLKKLLREDVSLNPTSTTTRKHYEVHMRYTELFLIYAEAANEAWGPTGTGSFSFSAKDVIGAIRQRAGITQPDNYLESITTKAQMRELIRNERRIELCFEGSRFYDLRRWKSDLTQTAKGININPNSMTVVDVEDRLYNNEYMHYGPIPETEVTKLSELEQNKGW